MFFKEQISWPFSRSVEGPLGSSPKGRVKIRGEKTFLTKKRGSKTFFRKIKGAKTLFST